MEKLMMKSKKKYLNFDFHNLLWEFGKKIKEMSKDSR